MSIKVHPFISAVDRVNTGKILSGHEVGDKISKIPGNEVDILLSGFSGRSAEFSGCAKEDGKRDKTGKDGKDKEVEKSLNSERNYLSIDNIPSPKDIIL